VLGIDTNDVPVGNFTGTGMHGGRIFIRTNSKLTALPAQVTAETASNDDLNEIKPFITEFAAFFNMDADNLTKEKFYVLKPNAKNPYKQLYTAN
jgi:glutamate synthase domain-containing protein 3